MNNKIAIINLKINDHLTNRVIEKHQVVDENNKQKPLGQIKI